MSQTTTMQTITVQDRKIDVAPLETIDLARLVVKDSTECQKLLRAAHSPGFFFLDFRNGRSSKEMLEDVPEMYALSDRYFSQPEEQKMKDYREGQPASQDRGYKASDCDETFEMAYDELVKGSLQLPPTINSDTELIKHFSENCHTACDTMLSCLSDSLNLDTSTRLERHHRRTETSDSGLKLIFEPSLAKLSDVGENKHTDSGTFTLLFYEQWGLHVYLPDEKRWAFAAVKPGCALVNVANSLQRLSGNQLHSPLHRVTQPADGAQKRCYLSYFMRPEHALKEAWAREDEK